MQRLGWIPALLMTATAAHAAGAPDGLRNKTIVASWIDFQEASFRPGEMHRDRVRSDLTIYVSSIGRVFTRHVRRNLGNGRNAAANVAPGDDPRKAGISTPAAIHFEGNRRLMTDFPAKSGARRVLITFDAGYGGCAIEVVYGKENGGGMKWMSFDGRMQDIISIKTESKSCAVSDGNALPDS